MSKRSKYIVNDITNAYILIKYLVIGSMWIHCVLQHITTITNHLMFVHFMYDSRILNSSSVEGIQVESTMFQLMYLSPFNVMIIITICECVTRKILDIFIAYFLLFVVSMSNVKQLIHLLSNSVREILIILRYQIN